MIWIKRIIELKWIVTLLLIVSISAVLGIRHIEREKEMKKLQSSVADIEMLKKMIVDREWKCKNIERNLNEAKSGADNSLVLAGMADVQGKGIVLTLSDNNDKDIKSTNIPMLIVHDSDILNILKELANAGAEAMSVNGQRILTTTCIKSGGPVILINGSKTASPFIIKAIGDPGVLMSRMKKSSILNLMKMDKLGVELQESELITIPGFAGNVKLQYAKPVNSID